LSKTFESDSGEASKAIAKSRVALGIFLLVLSTYVLTSPGRIDIVDGQARFDVAYNWLHSGRPIITDSWIRPWMAVPGRNNLPYSYYGAPASVFPMPLMALGSLFDGPSLGASQFLFSLTSSIFGALTTTILFLFYLELGLTLRSAFVWTMITAFTTLLWPASNSTFDNAQHAFFALASLYVGFISDRLNSRILAVLGGLLAAILVLYQEYFLLILPILALSSVGWTAARTGPDPKSPSSLREGLRKPLEFLRRSLTSPGKERESLIRYLLWLLTAVCTGLAISFLYNKLRFGSYFEDGKVSFSLLRGYPIFGNPLTGFTTLLLSPGKSIFLYSPPLLLGALGIRSLRQRQPKLGFVIIAASIVLVAFLSFIAFAGGDWCWGPRYLVVLLPLWSLAYPFALLSRNARGQVVTVAIITVGLIVQASAISVENQRFFFERKLHDFFWAEDPWFYFKQSALFSRFGEMLSLKDGPPASAQKFNSVPMSDWCTYTVLGPPPRISREYAPIWIRNFQIFYLPKPWPIWMSGLDPNLRPINLKAWLWDLGALECLGVLLISPLIRSRSFSQITMYRAEEMGVA